MSKYFTQWDSDTIGTIAGWTHRTAATAPTFVPAYGTPAVKRRYLAHASGQSGELRGLITWDAIDGDANRAKCNLLTCISADAFTAGTADLWARVAITGTTITDGYRLRLVNGGGAGSLTLSKRVASVTTSGFASASPTISAGKSYFIRFDLNGTALKAKIWDAALGMAGEPSAWDISTTDSGVSAAGYVGLAMNATAGTIVPWNFFAVGTNGDSAVCPRTNAEFLAWLGKPAKRKIVAILSATGYDSSASPYTKTVKYYISKGGFDSQEQDTPSRKHFESVIQSLPTFSRQMNAALVGPASISFGDLVLKNVAGKEVHIENRILRACAFDNASWSGAATVSTAAATPPPGRDRADQITDSSAAAFQAKTQQYTVPADTGTWRFTIDVKKTSGGTTPTFGINMNVTGGTSVSTNPILDTDTGATAFLDGGSVVPVIASDGTEYWRFTAKITNNGSAGNTTLTVNMYPAYAAPGLGSVSATHTGSAIISGAWLYRDPQAAYGNTVSTALDVRDLRPGRLDDLLRLSMNRSTVQILIGGEDFPLHDMRPLLVGRLGQPTAPTVDSIRFELGDMTDALNAPIQTSKFSGGDFDKQYKPTIIGRLYGPGCCEPPKTDAATLTYTLASGAIQTFFGYNAADLDVRDNGVRLVAAGPKVVTAVNTATETLTCVGHGLKADATVLFYTGTPPAPLALNTEYFVISAGLTADDFRLSATLGGAAINLTGAAGGTFEGYLYVLDKSAATLRLLSTPAGRVTVGNFDDGIANNTVATMYSRAAFTLTGLSPNFKDQTAFDSFDTVCLSNSYTAGLWLNTEQASCFDVMSRIAKGTGTWFGASFDGLLQVGLVGLPSTAVKSFTTANVKQASLKMPQVMRSIDFREGLWSYRPLYGSLGAVPTSDRYYQQGKEIYAYGAGNSAGIPLDDYPNQRDSIKTENVDTIFSVATGISNFIAHRTNLHKKPIGMFEFQSTIEAAWHANGPLSIGDTISLEHPRFGFKQYSAGDPASPDNTATIDARLAVVCGIDVNLDAPVDQQVTLKLYRHIVGNYPTADLN